MNRGSFTRIPISYILFLIICVGMHVYAYVFIYVFNFSFNFYYVLLFYIKYIFFFFFLHLSKNGKRSQHLVCGSERGVLEPELRSVCEWFVTQLLQAGCECL